MFEPKAFFDYSIMEKCLEDNKYEKTMTTLYNFGYRTVAINQVIEGSELEREPKKKNKKGAPREPPDPVPEPYKIIPVKGCEDLKILNRLTVVFGNQEVLHKITKSENYKKYDIIAALPTTTQATLFTCSNFEADIFCFNPESKNHTKRNRKMCRQLIERGYHFEIPYAPAIQDSTQRKNVIHTAHLYHAFVRSKNIIVSSGATDYMLIRGPYDIINLGLIFGLSEQQAKDAIAHCGRQTFINSVSRRHGKSVMFVETVAKPNTKEDPQEVSISENNNVKPSESVILLDSDEDMETDQPAQKKAKQ